MTILDAFLKTAASLRLDNPKDELCCVFHRAVLEARYGAAAVGRAHLKLWNLWPETGDAWGPVTAVVQAGIGSRVLAPVRGRWHTVQGWQGTPFGKGVPGHTFLWYEALDGSGGIRLDSADNRDPDGGFIDTIEDGPSATPTTWAAVLKRYPGGVALACLLA